MVGLGVMFIGNTYAIENGGGSVEYFITFVTSRGINERLFMFIYTSLYPQQIEVA